MCCFYEWLKDRKETENSRKIYTGVKKKWKNRKERHSRKKKTSTPDKQQRKKKETPKEDKRGQPKGVKNNRTQRGLRREPKEEGTWSPPSGVRRPTRAWLAWPLWLTPATFANLTPLFLPYLRSRGVAPPPHTHFLARSFAQWHCLDSWPLLALALSAFSCSGSGCEILLHYEWRLLLLHHFFIVITCFYWYLAMLALLFFHNI